MPAFRLAPTRCVVVVLFLLSLAPMSASRASIGGPGLEPVAGTAMAGWPSRGARVSPLARSSRAEIPKREPSGLSGYPIRRPYREVARRAAVATQGSRRLRVLCLVANKVKTGLGSFRARCEQMQVHFNNLLPEKVFFETGDYADMREATQAGVEAIIWDVVICVKFVPKFGEVAGMRHVFIDIVDADADRVASIPPYYHAIFQNEFQQAEDPRFLASHGPGSSMSHIIEHAYHLLNETVVPEIRPTPELRALSIMCDCMIGDAGCYGVDVEDLQYTCIKTSSTLVHHWYIKYNPNLDVRMLIDIKQVQQTPWGLAYLFNELFQNYQVIVVYSKVGTKLRWGSNQRMINAMKSGVPTVVQATGMHALYLPEHYPCTFTDVQSLELLLEELKDHRLREECQAMGLQIAEEYSPKAIVMKYAQAFEVALGSSGRSSRGRWRPLTEALDALS